MTTQVPRALQRLLHRVASRDHLRRLVLSATRAGLVIGVLYLLVGLCGRLTGYKPTLLCWSGLVIPAVAGVLWGLLTQRNHGLLAAARASDRALSSEDLLTSAWALPADPTGTDLHPVVIEQAARRAAAARAEQIIPWHLAGSARVWLVLSVISALLIWLTPTCDPFGHQQALIDIAKRRADLEVQHQAILTRIAQVKLEHPSPHLSPNVAAELDKLKAELAGLKPKEIAANHLTLAEEHAKLAQMLKKLQDSRFTHANDASATQELGGNADHAAAEQLANSLERGEAADMERALEAAKALVERMKAETDPSKRSALADQLERQLQTLAEAGKKHPSGFSSAMRQALEQLARSGDPELSQQALQSLSDALELSQLESTSDQQCLCNCRGLGKGLGVLHLAQTLNGQGSLPAEANAADLDEYAKLYAALISGGGGGGGAGQGAGLGLGGHGRGQRTDTSKDDAKVQATYTDEQDHTPLRAGTTLETWHVHGQSDPGKVIEEYRTSLPEVRQEVPEALEREQVPAAYHEGVKKYFDGLTTQP